MSKKINIVLPLFILLLFSNPVFSQAAQGRTSIVEGSIVLATNLPMERFEILLLSKDGEQTIAYTYTDLKPGNASMPRLV